jgi:hypothetical protein
MANVAGAIEQLREDMNRLRGRLFQSIEAVGLPEKQENAMKGVIRSTTYDAQANVEAALRGADGNHS